MWNFNSVNKLIKFEILCVILSVLILLISCTQKSEELWGETYNDLLNGCTESNLVNEIQSTYSEENTEINIKRAVCTENRIIVTFTAQNYSVTDILLYTDDLSEEISDMPFEDIKSAYTNAGFSKSINITHTDDGIDECTVDYCGNNKIAETKTIVLVLSDGSEVPVILKSNISDFGSKKAISVVDSKGNNIGKSEISQIYADIYLDTSISEDLYSFANNLFIVTEYENKEPLQSFIVGGGGHNIQLDFRKVLNIDSVVYLLYKE